MNDLVMATAAAEIARPAAAAGLLPIDDAFGEPASLPASINAPVDISHRCLAVLDEAVAGEQSS